MASLRQYLQSRASQHISSVGEDLFTGVDSQQHWDQGTQQVFDALLSTYQIYVNGRSLLPSGPKYSENASPHLNPPIEIQI